MFKPIIHPWNQELWEGLTQQTERRNHALLFTGSQGLGKQSLAMALAHQVASENSAQSKTLFEAGSHPDVHILMPEDKIEDLPEDDLLGVFARRYLEPQTGSSKRKPKRLIGIEQVRKLAENISTHPHIARTRVVLIAHAECMNRNSANGLLKNLEEPPANTLFIVISDEVSKLPKTIRSRCSLVNFRPPDQAAAEAWLQQQGVVPNEQVGNYLSMANNHPLLALTLYKEEYVTALKSVFTDVNGLWNQQREPVEVAKNWQSVGGLKCVEILQKLTTDLLRCRLADNPKAVFFPVQASWVKSASGKISAQKLFQAIDVLIDAKKMLATSVDELLVLESVSLKMRQLPAS